MVHRYRWSKRLGLVLGLAIALGLAGGLVGCQASQDPSPAPSGGPSGSSSDGPTQAQSTPPAEDQAAAPGEAAPAEPAPHNAASDSASDSASDPGKTAAAPASPSSAPPAPAKSDTDAIQIDETVCGAGGQEAYFETPKQEIYICKNEQQMLTYIATPKKQGNSIFLPAQKVQQGNAVGYVAIDDDKTYVVAEKGYQLKENNKVLASERVTRRQLGDR